MGRGVSTRSLCRALLALNLLYCALAAAQEGLPGWHMFESVDAVDTRLRDRSGATLDVRTYLPKDAFLTSRSELHEIIRFACERERSRAPFTFEDHGRHVTVGPEDCRVPRDHARR
jgi:hypothetical protein